MAVAYSVKTHCMHYCIIMPSDVIQDHGRISEILNMLEIKKCVVTS